MDHFLDETRQIKEILKSSRQGMSITDIARVMRKNKHSVGRYLDNLLVSGQVEMRTFGNAKVFSLSTRVPFDQMLGMVDDLIFVLDQDQRIVRINNQVLAFFEKDRNEFIGKNIQFLHFPESWITHFFERTKQLLASGNSGEEIHVPERGDRFFRQKNIPTVFEDGNTGMTILCEDITARKKADLALRASEEQFRLMAENIQDGIIIQEGHKTTYMNPRAEEILGYSREEIQALTPMDLAAPEDREQLRQVINSCKTEKIVPTDITFWIVRKDGSRRFISNRITMIQHKAGNTCYIIMTDMTEWKRAQEALENHLGFLQHMINTFPNPLFYADTTGRILGCNSAFCNMTGKKLEDIAGKTSGELFFGENSALITKYNEDLQKNAGVITYSGTFIHPDQSRSCISIQKSTLNSQDGHRAGIVGLVLSLQKIG